jgi:hypothetical protein
MPKRNTIQQRAVGVRHLNEHNEGRLERNPFHVECTTWEALRFCKNKDGPHSFLLLVLDEDKFVEPFEDAVNNSAFPLQSIDRLKMVLGRRDPFLDGIGIVSDGALFQQY